MALLFLLWVLGGDEVTEIKLAHIGSGFRDKQVYLL